ncbi:MAG: isoprenylcysteine carboxylmethyltransferase family protein [Candidatus Eisenbacteria bacterium]
MKEKNGEHPFGDIGQQISAGLFLIVWVVDSFLLRRTTFLAAHVPIGVRMAILVLTLITAFCLFRSGHVVVSHDRRPGGLVTTGAFEHIRHPLYLASMLAYLGVAVSTLSIFSLAMFVVIFLFHDYIATYEEQLLEAKFGEEYRIYRAKTGKWIPGL